jgi:hypothetical protein
MQPFNSRPHHLCRAQGIDLASVGSLTALTRLAVGYCDCPLQHVLSLRVRLAHLWEQLGVWICYVTVRTCEYSWGLQENICGAAHL